MIHGIITGLLFETGKAIIGKIAWEVIAERAITRGFVISARYLAGLTKTDFDDKIVDDIVKDLDGKGLPALKVSGTGIVGKVLRKTGVGKGVAEKVAEVAINKLANKVTNKVTPKDAFNALKKLKIRF